MQIMLTSWVFQMNQKMRRNNKKGGKHMDIYFSHPTFTFHTKTEKKCLEIMREYLDVDKIINPADFGLKKDVKEKIKNADAIVAMAVSKRFTYIVWREIELNLGKEIFNSKKQKSGEKLSDIDKEGKIYTFMVESKNDIGPLVEGIPEGIKNLDKSETKKFSYKITKKDYQDGFMSSLIGSHGSRF